MSEQLRQTLEAAAPGHLSTPDGSELWRRGRRRRRARQAMAGVAGLVVVLVVGWSIHQVSGPTGFEVVATPDDVGAPALPVQSDAVWRAPADDALDAVEDFSSDAFGWPASQLRAEGVTGGLGPMFVTVSSPPSEVSISLLLAAGQNGMWQIFQVQTAENPSGSMTPHSIEQPVPNGAATMDIHAWVEGGRTVHLRAPATPSIMLDQLGADGPDALGGGLIIYRNGAGQVVGASGGQWGMGGVEPTEPSRTPPDATTPE